MWLPGGPGARYLRRAGGQAFGGLVRLCCSGLRAAALSRGSPQAGKARHTCPGHRVRGTELTCLRVVMAHHVSPGERRYRCVPGELRPKAGQQRCWSAKTPGKQRTLDSNVREPWTVRAPDNKSPRAPPAAGYQAGSRAVPSGTARRNERCTPRAGGSTRHGDRLDKAGQPGGPVSAVYSPAAACAARSQCASRRSVNPAPPGATLRQAGETAPRSLRYGERRRDGG